MKSDNNQIKRWILPKPINIDKINDCEINSTLQKILYRRGINLDDELNQYLTPSSLPNPEDHFDELNKATQRIISACNRGEKIAICGDYDADGITSTVLLVELLEKLGAHPISLIPSRKEDGYGLNIKMIDEINMKGIKLIITVDNGISAFEAIKKSNDLSLDLIITDHHKIPNKNLEIFALIHPEKAPLNSPYKYLAGVGIAYMLAKNICDKLNFNIDKCASSVLFCIGTIADMAPLVGANRKWLKDSLPKIQSTNNLGIKSILKKLSLNNTEISSQDIGFKIAPLINSVGRISNPKIVIELLTSSSKSSISKLSNDCYKINNQRKRITALVEKEAKQLAHNEYINDKKFFVIDKKEWHPGVIGIVAARIVDKYNLPTAIISGSKDGISRGSIRSNNHLKVNLALNECSKILIAHGGHSSAAGFTINDEKIPELKERLNNIAIREFKNCNLTKSIKPDAYICLKDIDFDLYRQLMLIGPFGIMNQAPIFWTRKCRILDLHRLKGNHVKMILDDGTGFIDAIKWNFANQLKVDDIIDIAFYIEKNKWKNESKLQLNLIDIKRYSNVIDLKIHKNIYKCQLIEDIIIQVTNANGQCITSELSDISKKENLNQNNFEEKILSFAEIALGKTA